MGLAERERLTMICADPGKFAPRTSPATLPSDYFALPERNTKGPIPDALALKLSTWADEMGEAEGACRRGCPPKIRLTCRVEADIYAENANRITVRHRHGDIVAVIEIVSPEIRVVRPDSSPSSISQSTCSVKGQPHRHRSLSARKTRSARHTSRDLGRVPRG